jgi:predicted dehydrogenase
MPPPAKPTPEHRPVDRRNFFRKTTAAAALSLSASAYGKVAGANDRVRVAFLGCGGRAQAHINLVTRLAETGTVSPVAVCDVWDGLEEEYDQRHGHAVIRRKFSQGLYPSAAKCGLNPADRTRVAKDYRTILDLKEVDAVCISTPDHWHARMTLDSLAAGKDVYVEKPMTRTADEAVAVMDAAARLNRVVTVGVQSLADPVWKAAHEFLRTGKLGAVSHLSAGAFRSDVRGQWRFYRLAAEMTPRAVDWDLFLGHRFEVNGVPLGPDPRAMPFDRAAFAQWRCVSAFSGGPFTDLYVHHVTRLLAATGLRFPNRVTGSGGLYVERDGRDVPDVATIAADFDECHLVVTGATTSAVPQDEVIRGRRGAMKFVKGGFEVLGDSPETVRVESPKNETEALWANFLECVRRRDRATLCSPDLGAAAVAVVALAQAGHRDGRVYAWDRERRTAVPADAIPPVPSRRTGGDVQPPDYMRLAGPWVGGAEPG